MVQLSLFCHYSPVKTSEKQGNGMKRENGLKHWPARDLLDFVWLAECPESFFETARFNRSRTSPYRVALIFPQLEITVTTPFTALHRDSTETNQNVILSLAASIFRPSTP
jgi:hypothetical protein